MLAQGFDLTKNSYHNRLQPYVAYWGAAWTLFFILINGFAVFWHFDAAGFLTACEKIFLLLASKLILTNPPKKNAQTSTFRYLLSCIWVISSRRAHSFGKRRRWILSRYVFAPSFPCCIIMLTLLCHLGYPHTRRDGGTRSPTQELGRAHRRYRLLVYFSSSTSCIQVYLPSIIPCKYNLMSLALGLANFI